MKVLITGATGFIGRQLCQQLERLRIYTATKELPW